MLYPIAVVLTIVVTGNHFVLDALAGMLVLGLGFAVAAVLFERDGARIVGRDAGWSSQVARRAHNPEVAGSNPAPAMDERVQNGRLVRPFAFRGRGRPFGNPRATAICAVPYLET